MDKHDAESEKNFAAWEKAEKAKNSAAVERCKAAAERMRADHRRLFSRHVSSVSTLDHARRHLAKLRTEGEYERRLALALEHERLWTGGG